MKLELAIVEKEIAALLAANPELAEDEALRVDMIEGETDAFKVLSKLVQQLGETKALVEGLTNYQQELITRAHRFDRRFIAIRSLIFRLMTIANIRKAQLPEATLSIKASPRKVIVTDEKLIPEGFWRVHREIDKAGISTALKNNMNVPGAELSNSEDTLSIRTS